MNPDTQYKDDLASGLVYGVGIALGILLVFGFVLGAVGVASAAGAAYDDACTTHEFGVEYVDGEAVVTVEEQDPAWFCVTDDPEVSFQRVENAG